MKILAAGACGFVGSTLCETLIESGANVEITGADNLMRPGSETNRERLKALGVRFFHADLRSATDVEELPAAEWVIDAAAIPSVTAGAGGPCRRLIEHNLGTTVNLLEYCRRHGAGLLLLSSSRVYSVAALRGLPLAVRDNAYRLGASRPLPEGVTADGIGPGFSTQAPVSLYGASKLASERLAAEYGEAFGFPVWITRCGVLAGAGQFGTPRQGIVSYWIHAHRRRREMKYTGFGGSGAQTRDVLHPRDLGGLLLRQMTAGRPQGGRIYHAGGGPANAVSLHGLTAWCDARFGPHEVGSDPRERPFDVPWIVMESSLAASELGWRASTPLASILEEIARHAERRPDWLELSEA